MSIRQTAMTGPEFLARGWATSYPVRDDSIAIVCDDDGRIIWASWDDSSQEVTARCNPDLDLFDATGKLLRPAGPAEPPLPAPPTLTEVLGSIAAGPGTQDQKIAAIIAALAQSAPPAAS